MYYEMERFNCFASRRSGMDLYSSTTSDELLFRAIRSSVLLEPQLRRNLRGAIRKRCRTLQKTMGGTMDRNRRSGVCLSILAFGCVLVGCKEPGDDAPATPTPTVVSTASLPGLPAWAQPLQGKALTDFRSSTDCVGAFDVVKTRYTGAASGVEVAGWAWLKMQKKAPDHVLFADSGGGIVGAAETSMNRPDVPKALSEVGGAKVGWLGGVTRTTGNIRAYAVLPDQSLCQVGFKDIGG